MTYGAREKEADRRRFRNVKGWTVDISIGCGGGVAGVKKIVCWVGEMSWLLEEEDELINICNLVILWSFNDKNGKKLDKSIKLDF